MWNKLLPVIWVHDKLATLEKKICLKQTFCKYYVLKQFKEKLPMFTKKTHELCILVVTRQLILKFWQVIRNTLKHRGIGMSEIGNIKFENFQLKSYPVPLNQFDCSLETKQLCGTLHLF